MAAASRAFWTPMPVLLDLARSRSELSRQLLRRIGYTEGLFDVLRLADLVAMLSPHLPLPLAEVDRRMQVGLTQSRDQPTNARTNRSYAEGVRNVMAAMQLLQRDGNRMSLAPAGRALAAAHALHGPRSAVVRILVAYVAVDSDGDYLLNLLASDLEGKAEDVGEQMFVRVRSTIERKLEWLTASSGPRSVKEWVRTEFESIRSGLDAGRAPGRGPRRVESPGLTANTLRHTVSPRRGWLADLGLSNPNVRTEIFSLLRDLDQYSDGVVSLGLSDTLIKLGLDGFPRLNRGNLFTLAGLTSGQEQGLQADASGLLNVLRLSYPHLRLRSFNQLEIESLYIYWASTLASVGQSLQEEVFQTYVDEVVRDNAGEIWRLSAPRAKVLSGYLAMRAPKTY